MMLRLTPTSMGKLVSRITSSKIFYIYEGEMPTVDKDFVFNPANFVDQQLGKVLQGVGSTASSLNIYWSGPAQQFTPTKTGTAAWFAMVMADTNHTSGWPQAILGTITNDPSTNHPLLLSAIDLIEGQPQSCIDFSIKLGA